MARKITVTSSLLKSCVRIALQATVIFSLISDQAHASDEAVSVIMLPQPQTEGTLSVEQALAKRRSVRSFASTSLRLAEAAQLLWAAQGKTDKEGHRTAPSAGALYPLDLYLVAAKVDEVPPGVYHYRPEQHSIEPVSLGDRRTPLSQASHGQPSIADAPAVFIFAAEYSRSTAKYGARGERYAHIEVGHAAQNVYLQSAALGLGTVAVGAFDDEKVKSVLALPKKSAVLYLMPVGKPG